MLNARNSAATRLETEVKSTFGEGIRIRTSGTLSFQILLTKRQLTWTVYATLPAMTLTTDLMTLTTDLVEMQSDHDLIERIETEGNCYNTTAL